MGAESFFVQLLPSGVTPEQRPEGRGFRGHCAAAPEALLSALQKAGHRLVPDGDGHALDGVLRLSWTLEEGRLQALTLEGCFSWFEEALESAWTLAQELEPVVGSWSWHHPLAAQAPPPGAREPFIAWLGQLYAGKRARFVEQFGAEPLQSLPGDVFYAAHRRRQGLWSRLWSRRP